MPIFKVSLKESKPLCSVISTLTRTLEGDRWHSKLLDSCWGLEFIIIEITVLKLVSLKSEIISCAK